MKPLLLPVFCLSLMLASCRGCKEAEPGPAAGGTDLLTDSLEFDTVDADKQWGDCEKAESNCVSVILEYPKIKGNDSQAQVMNSIIQQWLLGDLRDSLNSPEQLADWYIAEYQRNRKPSKGTREGWQIEKIITVLTNHHGIFSMRLEELEQTGAANPHLNTSFVNYNLNTGKQLVLSDFLHEGFEDSLAILAEFYYRRSRELSFEEDLEPAGFNFRENKYHLRDNFVLDETGLTFTFNSFEASPTTTGLIEFTVPYAELINNNLVKPDGPLAFLISEPTV